MNSKMKTNSQLLTIEPKKQKLSKQQQEQNHRNEITWRVIIGEGKGRMGERNRE